MKTVCSVTAGQISQIYQANERVKGTSDYSRYRMGVECKQGRKWGFIGWGVPMTNLDGVIKQSADSMYLVIGDTRYLLRSVHKELLGL